MYFKYLSLILGIVTVLPCLFWWVAPKEKYRQFMLEKLYPEKMPKWFYLIAVAWGVLVIYSWQQYFSDGRLIASAICLYVTFGLGKIFFGIFNYATIRKLVEAFLKESFPFKVVLFCAILLGLGLMGLGLFVL